MPHRALVILALLSLAFSAGIAHGAAVDARATDQVATDVHTIGTRVAPPFVIDEGDGIYSGLTISLWQHIAAELGIGYRFEVRTIEGMIAGVEDGTLFAAASALTITADRESRVDFTHPFLVTGLGIAVPHESKGMGIAAIMALFSPRLLWVVALLLGLLLFWGTLVWIFERHHHQGEFGGSAAHGIGSGFWWAAVTMTTVGYGDKSPRTLGGRVVGFFWMFTAIIVISFFTASIASSLTLTQLGGRVTGPQDLHNVRVGVLADAAAVELLASDGIATIPHPSIEAGLEALANGAIDAFVHDAPILRYQQQAAFADRVRILSATFMEHYYGIALPIDSPHRNEINQALLEFLAGDDWNRLKRRYLGTS